MPGESCPECRLLVGHGAGCSLKPKTERELGWNEAIERAAHEAAHEAEVSGFNVLAETIRALKR